jgi:hypothetical protein
VTPVATAREAQLREAFARFQTAVPAVLDSFDNYVVRRLSESPDGTVDATFALAVARGRHAAKVDLHLAPYFAAWFRARRPAFAARLIAPPVPGDAS